VSGCFHFGGTNPPTQVNVTGSLTSLPTITNLISLEAPLLDPNSTGETTTGTITINPNGTITAQSSRKRNELFRCWEQTETLCNLDSQISLQQINNVVIIDPETGVPSISWVNPCTATAALPTLFQLQSLSISVAVQVTNGNAKIFDRSNFTVQEGRKLDTSRHCGIRAEFVSLAIEVITIPVQTVETKDGGLTVLAPN